MEEKQSFVSSVLARIKSILKLMKSYIDGSRWLAKRNLKKLEKEKREQKETVINKLKQLCGMVEASIPIVYLADAISKKATIYLTTDLYIVSQKELIEKEFPIKICTDVAEAMYLSKNQTSFDTYLEEKKENGKGIISTDPKKSD